MQRGEEASEGRNAGDALPATLRADGKALTACAGSPHAGSTQGAREGPPRAAGSRRRTGPQAAAVSGVGLGCG